MPYIPEGRRIVLLPMLDEVAKTAGELNYQITELLLMYEDEHGVSYQTSNDIIGALEGAKLEYYRRMVAPYEDKKIEENGDVY